MSASIRSEGSRSVPTAVSRKESMSRMVRTVRKTRKGFSLAEVLLSIAVMTVGLLPILASISESFSISIMNRDSVTASGLAQEGVELVKNLKDNDETVPSGTCRIDYDDTSLSCAVSSFDLSGAPLGHAGTAGKFERRLFLSGSGGMTTCVSAVSWGEFVPTADNARSDCTVENKCAYAESNLADWR